MLDPIEKLRKSAHVKNPLVRNILSEFFGTMMLLVIGLGIVMQFILTHEKLNHWININVGWGFAITFCVLATSQTSGGHLNPAISFFMFTIGRINAVTFVLYSIAQTIGAFVGTGVAYAVYYDQFQKFAGNRRHIVGNFATAGCFCSFPPAHVSNATSFLDQVVGTGLLAMFVMAIIDRRNKIPGHMHALLFGLVLIMIGCAYGLNLGYPINPARDLGPRIFAYFIYGSEVFSYHNTYFWVPVVAPFIGAPLGGWLYIFFVGLHVEDPLEVITDLPKRVIEDRENGTHNDGEQKRLLKGDSR